MKTIEIRTISELAEVVTPENLKDIIRAINALAAIKFEAGNLPPIHTIVIIDDGKDGGDIRAVQSDLLPQRGRYAGMDCKIVEFDECEKGDSFQIKSDVDTITISAPKPAGTEDGEFGIWVKTPTFEDGFESHFEWLDWYEIKNETCFFYLKTGIDDDALRAFVKEIKAGDFKIIPAR